MRFLPVTLLLLAPMAAFAEDVIPPAIPPNAPAWMQLVMMIVGTVVLPFIGLYFKNKSAAAKAESEQIGLSAKERIFKSLQAFALERAGIYAEREILAISQMVVAGTIKDSATVKAHLRILGDQLKTDLIRYAKDNFDLNLVESMGDEYIDSLVRWAADKVSPFPGKDTAAALVSGGAKMALKYGVKKADAYLDAQLDSHPVKGE